MGVTIGNKPAENKVKRISMDAPEVNAIKSMNMAMKNQRKTIATQISALPQFAANTPHTNLLLKIFEKEKELNGESKYVTIKLGDTPESTASVIWTLTDMTILEMLKLITPPARGALSVKVTFTSLGEEVAEMIGKRDSREKETAE